MPEPLGYQFDRLYAGAIERYRQVTTIAERDAIPSGKRWEGMLCYVTGTETDYQLRGGLTNGDWVAASQGNYFDLSTNDSDDITEGLINLFLSQADQDKLDFITVTQAVDLDALESAVDALGAGITFIDEWDASSGSFPGGGTAAIGDFYVVSVAGTVDGVSFAVGDGLIAKTTNASTTTFAGNWVKTESTSDVTSVVGLTGVITKSELLAALNVEDGATADQTGAEIVSLINSELTTAGWQTKLTEEEVLDFVGTAIVNGTQIGIQVSYDDANDAFNFTVNQYFGVVYGTLATLVADQAGQNDFTLYEVTDASGFTSITSGRAWVRYKGTTAGDETDYIIVSAEEWGAGLGTSLDTSNFDNNLDNTVTDVQKLADAVDELLIENVSPQYITTSGNGCISDADVSLGSTTFGTDNLAALQAILDQAQTNPIVVIWDGKYSISGALTIYSNTHIIGTDGSGVILQNDSDAVVFVNANPTESSATGGYGSNIVDENITIENLIINGNGYNTGVGGDAIIDVAGGGDPTNGSAQTKDHMMKFVGIRNLYFKSCKFYASRAFACRVRNSEFVTFDKIEVDFGESSTRDPYNYDGIHFDGYGRFLTLKQINLKKCKDDSIAFNANTSVGYPSGPILDVYVDDVCFNDNSALGFKFLSSTQRIDRVHVSNIYGNTTGWWLTIANGGLSGDGDCGSFFFDNINVVCEATPVSSPLWGTSNISSYVNTNVNIEKLVFRNIIRTDFYDEYSYIQVKDGVINQLIIDNVMMNSSGGTFDKPFFELLGTTTQVEKLMINNLIHKEDTSDIDAPVVNVQSGTLNALYLSNCDVTNVLNIVHKSGGNLFVIQGSNIRHVSSSEAAFKTTSGSIPSLILSTFFSTVNLITSGTFGSKKGDAFDYGDSTVASLPSASQYKYAFVTDETGGAVPAFSDGIDWRRVTDRAVVVVASTPVPTANIISYWELDSDSLDQVGTNNGTDTSISYVAGKVSNAADFSAGTSSKIEVADDNTLSFGDGSTDSPFSGSIWLNFSSTGDQIILNKRDTSSGAAAREWQLSYVSGAFEIILFDQSTGGLRKTIYTFAASTSVWYNIQWTYDGSSQPKLYLDSVDVGSASNSGSYTAMENGTAPLTIGKYAVNTSFSFDGLIDEFVLFDKELSASEVISVYDKGDSGTPVNM